MLKNVKKPITCRVRLLRPKSVNLGDFLTSEPNETTASDISQQTKLHLYCALRAPSCLPAFSPRNDVLSK